MKGVFSVVLSITVTDEWYKSLRISYAVWLYNDNVDGHKSLVITVVKNNASAKCALDMLREVLI
ncbi:MAG: hypothetical protein II393_03875 [Cytophagales bacterium]|nr:hypothetical protein [Cytophagales bacterium]